jgi:DNA-binding NarL/FixJ family response regulator
MNVTIFGNETLIHHSFYSLFKDVLGENKIVIEQKKNFKSFLTNSESVLIYLLDDSSEFDITLDYSKSKVVLITLIKDFQLDVNWFKSGVKAILDCKSDFFELKLALQQMKEDNVFLSHNLTNEIIKNNFQQPDKELSTDNFLITKRELQIINYLKKGHTSKEIGNILHISNRTIDKHKTNIFKKLNVNNVVGLINKMKDLES